MASMLLSPGCCCAPAVCNVTFNVKGCNGLNLPGATVNIWTDSGMGTLVGTGVTNASGNAVIDIGTAGTYWRESKKTRFTTDQRSTTPTCGGSPSVTLSADSSLYVCISGCVDPIAKTLFFTDALLGTTLTLVWRSSPPAGELAWGGAGASAPMASLGGAPCTAGTTTTVTISYDGRNSVFASWPTLVSPSGCPSDAGTFNTGVLGFGTCPITTCPNSYASSGTLVASTAPAVIQRLIGTSGTFARSCTE